MQRNLLTLKLKESAELKPTLSRLSGITGVIKIYRLFPKETSGELANLYNVSLKPTDFNSVLGKLVKDKDVEYAHEPAKRQLA